MRLQDKAPRQTTGLLIAMAAGILIGLCLPQVLQLLNRFPAAPDRSPAPRTPAPVPAAGLTPLAIDIPDAGLAYLAAAREQALRQQILSPDCKSNVQGRITVDGNSWAADLRLKGDWTDHVLTDQWSFRIDLKDGHFHGMQTFSVQRPATKGYLWEWLAGAMARDAGLLAPRSEFVEIILNGESKGLYYLEEHFARELLESQQRREGPIVCLAEDGYWLAQLQTHSHFLGQRELPAALRPAFTADRAAPRLFDERRADQLEALNRQATHALSQLADLQRQWLTTSDAATQLEQLQALATQRQDTLDGIFDLDALARAHALLTLLQAGHALEWINQRYYHNPVTARLEPVLFDINAHDPDSLSGLPMELPHARFLADIPRYLNAYYDELAKYLDPEFIDQLIVQHGYTLNQVADALLARNALPDEFLPATLLNRLRERQRALREALRPTLALNCVAHVEGADDQPDRYTIHAWAATRVPVAVSRFQLQNGLIIPAAAVVTSATGLCVPESDTEAVIIPGDGRHVVFSFPADARLAFLRDVDAIKQAIREDTATDQGNRASLDVTYRLLTETAPRRMPLEARRSREAWQTLSRPLEPTLDELLAQQPFLLYDAVSNRLVIPRGVWTIDRDLVVPAGTRLVAGPGTTLRFAANALLVSSSPLTFTGEVNHPVVLEPVNPDATWPGALVLQAGAPSEWNHVVVRRAAAIDRGGWQTTGGITFFAAPVEFAHCRFEQAQGEDALNVVGTTLSLRQTTFDGTASDAFDGDFISGDIMDCIFRNVAADGIDVSGSQVSILNNAFEQIGDKALSIGEKSRALVRRCRVAGATIGVAAKDLSSIDIADSTFTDIVHYTLTAYIKKDEFGPSTILAVNLVTDRPAHLVQHGSRITLDNADLPTRHVNVEQMYRDRILGQ